MSKIIGVFLYTNNGYAPRKKNENALAYAIAHKVKY